MASLRGQVHTPGEAIARIAYLASDVVVSVQPSQANDSEFSSHLKRYEARKGKSLVAKGPGAVPEMHAVRHNADPLLSVFAPIRAGKLVSVTTSSTTLVPSITHLYKLANFPVVIHVSLQPASFPDYSAITAIRNAGWTFLQSESLQEAQDLALTAHALALRSGKGVIHFFATASSDDDEPIDAEDIDVVREVLDLDTARRFQSSADAGSGIYADDGRVPVASDRSDLPATNGSAAADLSASVHSKFDSARASELSSQHSTTSSPPSVTSAATTIESSAPPVTSEDILRYTNAIWAHIKRLVGREYTPFYYAGPTNAENCLFVFGSGAYYFGDVIDQARRGGDFSKVGIIAPRLYRPWLGASFVEALPKTVKRIAVLEQIHRRTTKWGPVLVDVLTSVKSGFGGVETIVGYQLGYIDPKTVTQALRGVLQNLTSEKPIQNLEVGRKEAPKQELEYGLEKPKIETAYTKILDQLFGQRVYLANALKSSTAGISSTIVSSPEFGFGSLIARKEHRARFVNESWLARWASNAHDAKVAGEVADDESLWLVGSDAWSYDLGNSGVHHVLASGENKDIGLSYTQVLQAMLEADQFDGPSETKKAVDETKKAVDVGYWPLYRWNPQNEAKGEPNFSLDSEHIKNELKEFLKRDNQLTQLMNKDPAFAANLAQDFGTEVRAQQKRKAKDAYDALLEGLLGAPLTVLFASDNGNATSVMSMEDYPLEDLPSEENIVFDNTELDLANVNYSVFGLGDKHYWPRKEDKIYYNKPAKDLDRVLSNLRGKRLADEWEPKIWQALGVDNVEGLPEEPAPITNEDIKIASNFLRGTIVEGLADTSTGAISASDLQLTKFHGTYMQDDRDLRDERKAQGLEPAYSFMIRCRLDGGVATPLQWVQMDDISNTLGNETMKLTTRQTFQFHGIVKGKLKPAMQAINRALMTTIAACGDVNRNIMCSSLPTQSAFHKEVWKYSQVISDHLLPQTTAYHEIWLTDDDNKKTQVAGNAVQDFEPLYGPTYLPRKFKITMAIPPHNDTDVYAHDIGLIAIKGKDGKLAGFNVLAGGGMGTTHNNKKTYPQIGRHLGFCTPDQVHIACEKIMLVQRDNGDRKNRKHARLKYTIDDMGVDVFRGKVEELWGRKFEKQRPFEFKSNVDTFGWQKDETGLNHFTFFIENGRIEDTTAFQMKTGLRELAKLGKGEFRLTGNQHLILSNIADAELDEIKALLKKFKLDNLQFSSLRLSSSACVAFPTCGLAMAESERYLPVLIDKLEATLEEAGLKRDSIVMRMTGCPNGCARPWLAEVAFVGKAFGAYNMYLGGGYHGQRLNKLYRSSIKEDEILAIMRPLLKRYAAEREKGERFGDFCIRVGVIVATREGRDFHDNVAEEESDEE
ncbi:hypothetical protein HYQ45_008306 [Verticillium longisporum]|uniref:assimilatory sulfite reductase (NADPH) n=1 Tax=Verticillium longisporum TaxID=100787 RepID=A0A8I3ATM8_VERLO|nr:hypothetical protein HYQ45_008306 [Verticillium longisporum]